MHNKILQASLLVALSGILYGFMGYFGIRAMQTNMSLSSMLFWRFFIAGCWMLLFMLPRGFKKKSPSSLNAKSLAIMFLLGIFAYTGSTAFFFIASQYTGTGVAMVIFFSYPILIALASWFFKPKSFNWKTLLILLLMSFGLFLLRGSTEQDLSYFGIIFALMSAACYALYVVGSKKFATPGLDTALSTMVVCFSCSLSPLTHALLTHSFSFPSSFASWSLLLSLGILITALPIQLMLEGLKYISSLRASIISVLEPLMTLVAGIILLDESITYLQMIGACIIMGSALLVQLQKEV